MVAAGCRRSASSRRCSRRTRRMPVARPMAAPSAAAASPANDNTRRAEQQVSGRQQIADRHPEREVALGSSSSTTVADRQAFAGCGDANRLLAAAAADGLRPAALAARSHGNADLGHVPSRTSTTRPRASSMPGIIRPSLRQACGRSGRHVIRMPADRLVDPGRCRRSRIARLICRSSTSIAASSSSRIGCTPAASSCFTADAPAARQ
jgi:hypothetical protein